MLSLRGEYFWLGKNILLLQYCFTFLILSNYFSLVFVLLSKHCICICIIVFVFVFLPNSILYVFKRVRGSVPVSSHVMFVQSSLFLLLATKTKLVADLDGQLPLASLRAGDSWAIHPAIEGNFVFHNLYFCVCLFVAFFEREMLSRCLVRRWFIVSEEEGNSSPAGQNIDTASS